MIEELVTNKEAATRLKRSIGYVCALKKVCGLHRVTRFPYSKLVKYLHENPTFRVSEAAYGSKRVARQQKRGRKHQGVRKVSERK